MTITTQQRTLYVVTCDCRGCPEDKPLRDWIANLADNTDPSFLQALDEDAREHPCTRLKIADMDGDLAGWLVDGHQIGLHEYYQPTRHNGQLCQQTTLCPQCAQHVDKTQETVD